MIAIEWERIQRVMAQQEDLLALLETLFTKAPIGVAFLDPQLRFKSINERLAAFNGLAVEAHLGRTIWEVGPNLAAQQVALFTEVLATGTPLLNVELTSEHPAYPGQLRVGQASYYPVYTADQRCVGISMFVIEITEQRRTEQVERLMADLSAALINSLDYQATLDALARVTIPFLADWCAIDMVGEPSQAHFLAMAHADPVKQAVAHELQRRYPDSPQHAKLIQHVLVEHRSVLLQALSAEQIRDSVIDADHLALLEALHLGTMLIVPLLVKGSGIGALMLARTAGAAPYTADDLALAEEIARRTAATLEKLRLFATAGQSRILAEEAVRVRDAFFSIAAHELRTPLTTLLGRAQLLQKWLTQGETADPRNLRSMQIIVEQAQRLNRMISALLDASRIESGRFSIESVPMDLRTLAGRVIEETRLTMASHTFTLRVAETPVMVAGDEVRLEQVLQNLVSNAVKYSPGGGEVQIEVLPSERLARVAVSDQGIGIPADSRAELFRRFYRAANAEALGISGMGIGLFVVNEIVELHGGRIDVTSTEGKGSTFTVWLPLLT